MKPMIDSRKEGKPLPYGNVITKIFKETWYEFKNEEVREKSSRMGKYTLSIINARLQIFFTKKKKRNKYQKTSPTKNSHQAIIRDINEFANQCLIPNQSQPNFEKLDRELSFLRYC